MATSSEEYGHDDGTPITCDPGTLAQAKTKVSLLPCHIHHDGPAPVSRYFIPRELKAGEDRDAGGEEGVVAAFRGRKLLGKEMELPEGSRGLVLREAAGTAGASWFVEEVFDRVTVYGHDRMPSKANPVISAMEWLDVAQAIHDP
jgi:ribonuclease H2 subunit C